MEVLGWNFDISRGMDETEMWGMERRKLQIRFQMDSILILWVNYIAWAHKDTQDTVIKLQGADNIFILVVGAAKSCRFPYLNKTMTIISFNKKSSFQVGFECYVAVRRHFSYIAEQKE